MKRGERQPEERGRRAFRKQVTAGAGWVALLAIAAVPVRAAEWHWNAGSGTWTNSSNWLPNSVPPDDAEVFLGSLASAANGTVTLGPSTEVASLDITDGMTLNTDHSFMHVLGSTIISGSNMVGAPGGIATHYPSRLVIGSVDGLSFWTNDLVVTQGGRLSLDHAYIDVEDEFLIGAQSRMTGNGTAYVEGAGTALSVNGILDAGVETGLEFIVTGDHQGSFDLDGSLGTGSLVMDAPGSRLTFVGPGLTDSFGGTIEMVSDTMLNMALYTEWVADANSTINVTGSGPGLDRALIAGTSVRLAGAVNVDGDAGDLRLLPSVDVAPTAQIHVGAADRLRFESNLVGWLTIEGGDWQIDEGGEIAVHHITDVQGGTFTLAQGAQLHFLTETEIHGGTFSTASPHGFDGVVGFYGSTVWDGVVDAQGYMVQYDEATVAGPTIINAEMFNLDGMGETVWNINSALVINAAAIEDNATGFGGTINVDGGNFGKLTLNLDDPTAAWTMDGVMNLAGGAGLYNPRVAGSPLHLAGELNLLTGKSQISSDTVFGESSTIDFAVPTASLRMAAHTWIDPGATFTGDGTLVNGTTGEMSLGDGVELNGVGLINTGTLEIVSGGAAGVASADRFTNTGQWIVDIGGYSPGSEHDLLLVDGETELGGTLAVQLVDLGGGGAFVPQIGDEFTILYSLGGVNGTFASDPTTVVGDVIYGWSVLYGDHVVTLRLDSIAPEPVASSLLLAGLALIAPRRRARQR